MLRLAFVLVGALAGAASAAPHAARTALETPAAAAARVAACGFKNARPRYDAGEHENVVKVPEAPSASEEQLRCVALASYASSYYVRFPPEVEKAYLPLYWRLATVQEQASARLWLEKRGLLARLPKFDPAQGDVASFAPKLERLCGPRAMGSLQPLHGLATFKEGRVLTLTKRGFSRGSLDEKTLTCLLHAAAASGYPLMFIGNGPAEPPN